jgi:hypothetical protein
LTYYTDPGPISARAPVPCAVYFERLPWSYWRWLFFALREE